MTDSNEMDAFVQEGLMRYAKACDAVATFKAEVHARLQNAFEGHIWSRFTPRPLSVSGAFEPGSGPGDKRAIWMTQNAADKGDGSVVLGLWWHPPSKPGLVVAYCARWSAKGALISVELPDPKRPVQVGAINPRGSRLFVALTQDSNLPEVLGCLLVEMDRALKPLDAALDSGSLDVAAAGDP